MMDKKFCLTILICFKAIMYKTNNCEPPFELLVFPGVKINPVARSQWTKLLNSKNKSVDAKQKLTSVLQSFC